MSADHDAPRQRFRDLKPYEVVDSLDDLQGPAAGSVHLPRWVRWQADGEVDIDDPGGLRMAYQALLSEGTSEIQAQLLNRRPHHSLADAEPRQPCPRPLGGQIR